MGAKKRGFKLKAWQAYSKSPYKFIGAMFQGPQNRLMGRNNSANQGRSMADVYGDAGGIGGPRQAGRTPGRNLPNNADNIRMEEARARKNKNQAAGMGGTHASGAALGSASNLVSGMFSDIRLKENINKIGISKSGIPIYEFNYIGDNNKYSGAMAQDLLEINPSVVNLDKKSGYYKVNYNNIDVDMRLLN